MRLTWNMAVLCVVGICAILAAGGCTCGSHSPDGTGPSGASLGRAVMSGFESPPSRLFVSKGRLFALMSQLGYDANEYSYSSDHSSDGTSLRCWNQHRSKAVVFARGKTPTLVETPRWAYLDDDNRPVAWYGGDASDYTINFRNGIKLFLPGFHLDSGGQLFCYGGNYYDYAAGKARELPIQISAVGNPKTAVAKSELKGLIGNIFTTDKKVFLILLFQDHVICEEFTREQNALERSRQFEIRPPTKAAVEYVVVEDYDPTSGSFLVKVGRHLPLLGGPLWFVYDPDTGDFRKVGVFEGYAGFLDRDIFDKALDQASALPLRPRNPALFTGSMTSCGAQTRSVV